MLFKRKPLILGHNKLERDKNPLLIFNVKIPGSLH